jgi:hypothetical protein
MSRPATIHDVFAAIDAAGGDVSIEAMGKALGKRPDRLADRVEGWINDRAGLRIVRAPGNRKRVSYRRVRKHWPQYAGDSVERLEQWIAELTARLAAHGEEWHRPVEHETPAEADDLASSLDAEPESDPRP